MGKRRKRNSFKPSDVFMKAYTRTLEKAVNSKYGKSDFRCDECPFEEYSDECTDPSCKVGAGFERTFEQWQEWFYDLTGNKDDRPKDMFLEKNEQTKEPTEQTEQKTQTKYEVEYTALDSNKPRTRYARKVVDLLFLIKQWNDEAIKWNLIANGDVSKIPPDFKSIYIKVYINDCDLIFHDEYTLESKGLKLGWMRSEN